MNNLKRKNVFIKAVPALSLVAFILTLMFSYFGALTLFGSKTIKANAADNSIFVPSEVSVSNNGFDSYSGGFPYTPSSWTEKTIPNTNKGSAVSGIIDLDTYNNADNIRAAKLDIYPEYKETPPATPSVTGTDNLPDSKFLMINTATSRTAYGYSSSGVSIESNKYYEVSAWVKTGNFIQNTGAAIRLDGLDGNYAFSKINTASDLNYDNTKLGWIQYTFYIAGSPLTSHSMNITLSVGDYYSSDDETVADYATGYAFFDNVSVYEISADNYNSQSIVSSDYKKTVDLGIESAFADEAEEKSFNFDNIAQWTTISHNSSGIYPITTDAADGFERFGLENNPVSSTGTNSPNEALKNVLVFSSYNEELETYSKVSLGLRSPTLTIERFRYYRLSAWVYTNEINDGSGATLIVNTDKKLSTEDDDYQTFTITNATGDSSNKARYGWKEYAFYIQGSAIGNNEISLELRLGQEDKSSEGESDNRSSGTAMFHNVSFSYITSSEFSSYSSNGTIVTFDNEFAANNAGVTNGAFMTAGDYKDYEFPLAPASWTYIDAGTAGTVNYSNTTTYVNDDNILSGIVPTDTAHFNSMNSVYSAHSLSNRINDVGNMLVISSLNSTAVGYRSSDITITAATSYKLSVNLAVDLISGYGANLVLKNSSNKVIASIEKIKSTQNGTEKGGFQTFTFYIEGGEADNTVMLEIWLGLIDRDSNNTKLSVGNVYVDTVSCTALGENESYSAFETKYNEERTLGRNVPFAAYTFSGTKLDAFDYYDNNYVKYPYNWELNALGTSSKDGVKYGIFDYSHIPAWQAEVPSTFKNKDASSNYVLLLNNTSPAATSLNYSGSFNLTASTKYRLSVTVKTDISYEAGSGNTDSSVGAGIVLSGTEYKFENIRSTAEVIDTIIDNETFRTYSFYIISGSEDTSLGLNITLGSGNYSAAYCAGRVYVNNIDFAEVNDSLYEEITGELTDDELLEKFIIKADLTVPAEDTETDPTNNSINWWLVPSILFSVTLVVVLLGVGIRKLADNIAAKRGKKTNIDTTYDRAKTAQRIRPDGTADDVTTEDNDRVYEEFDDVLPPAPNKLKPRTEVTPRPIAEKSETPITDTSYDEFDDSIPQEKEETAEESAAEQNAEVTAEEKTVEENPSEKSEDVATTATAVDAEQAATTNESAEQVKEKKIVKKPIKKAEPQPKDPSMDEFDD